MPDPVVATPATAAPVFHGSTAGVPQPSPTPAATVAHVETAKLDTNGKVAELVAPAVEPKLAEPAKPKPDAKAAADWAAKTRRVEEGKAALRRDQAAFAEQQRSLQAERQRITQAGAQAEEFQKLLKSNDPNVISEALRKYGVNLQAVSAALLPDALRPTPEPKTPEEIAAARAEEIVTARLKERDEAERAEYEQLTATERTQQARQQQEQVARDEAAFIQLADQDLSAPTSAFHLTRAAGGGSVVLEVFKEFVQQHGRAPTRQQAAELAEQYQEYRLMEGLKALPEERFKALLTKSGRAYAPPSPAQPATPAPKPPAPATGLSNAVGTTAASTAGPVLHSDPQISRGIEAYNRSRGIQ